MKKRTEVRKVIYLLMVFTVIIIVLAGCGKEKVEEETTKKVVDPSELITVVIKDTKGTTGSSPEEVVEYFNEEAGSQFEEILAKEDSVEIKLTKEQIDFWKKHFKDIINDNLSRINKENCRYYGKCDESCELAEYMYTLYISEFEENDTMNAVDLYRALYGYFDGKEDCHNLVSKIYNADTGKLVSTIIRKPGGHIYNQDDWLNSYTLTSDEISNLVDNVGKVDRVIKAKSNFVNMQGLDLIITLQRAGKADYKYLYLDEEGFAFLGVDENQREGLIKNIESYMRDMRFDLRKINSAYDIKWSEDYSRVEVWMDANIDAQQQGDTILEIMTLCMFCQLLSGDPLSYYTDVSVYNSATGQLASIGNSIDGISWNLVK